MPENKIILDLCGGTGAWSRPYAEAGYDVRIITLAKWNTILFPSRPSSIKRLPSEFDSIEEYPKVWGVLAAPVCTVFTGSSACWPRSDAEIEEGLALVDACLRIVYVTNPVFWCLENPVGKLRKWIGPPIMSFQPCDYGDPYKKRTLLWGKFNMNLQKKPVEPIIPSPLHQKYGGKSARTKQMRSITPPGFAQAFFEANP